MCTWEHEGGRERGEPRERVEGKREKREGERETRRKRERERERERERAGEREEKLWREIVQRFVSMKTLYKMNILLLFDFTIINH